ncbi:hypothetical protein ABZ901_23245 [Actinacidiphila alni]|uniref:hypothetical protein n=1 Tax=Actinacidiphila alni TaxID=380248 RepID=UPI0033C297B9
MPVEALCEWPAEAGPLDVDGEDALTLFTRRVADTAPDALTAPGAAEAAVALCRRPEGIPPALELAAARAGPARRNRPASPLSSGPAAATSRAPPARRSTARSTTGRTGAAPWPTDAPR